MRLWSKELINVLPRNQLIAQWREIMAIVGSIKKKGYPNHILVNKIMDYPYAEFSSYTNLVIDEMTNRGYKVNKKTINKFYEFAGNYKIDFNEIYCQWHDEVYLKICLYNLYEKYICGGIEDYEWNKIIEKFSYLKLF